MSRKVDFYPLGTPPEPVGIDDEYPVSETLLREPNLFIPGKKPLGPVKLNWNHPLAKDFTEGVLFYPLTGWNDYRGLNGDIYPATYSTDQTPAVSSKTDYIQLNGILSDGTGQHFALPSKLEPGTDSWTWLFEIRIRDYHNLVGIVGNGCTDNVDAGIVLRTTNEPSLQLVVGNGTSRVIARYDDSFLENEWLTIACIIDRAGDLSLLLSTGFQHSVDISSHSGSYTNGSKPQNIGKIDGTFVGNFDMRYLYHLKRALSIAEAREWMTDPHQFLIPA